MKILYQFAFIAVTCTQSICAQHEKIEVRIRKLETDQVKYLLRGELDKMMAHSAEDFTVNNPFSVIQKAATGPIQTGTLTYSQFERNIESIIVRGSTVIVMGNELVVPRTAPTGSSHDTTGPIHRRFTNIWMQKGRNWLMIARHANVVCSP